MKILKWLGLSGDNPTNGHTINTYNTIEKHYRSFLDEMEDGYYEVYLNGRFVYFNNYFSRLTGFRPRELQQRTLFDLIADDSRPQIENIFRKIYLTGLSTNMMEWKINRRDGVRRTFEASATTRKPLVGEDVLIRGVVRDITDLKETEKMLRYKNPAISINDNGFAVIDAGNNHTILHCNTSFEIITGYNRDELLGKEFTILYGPHTDSETANNVKHALNARRECRTKIECYRKDKSIFWNEVTFSPVYDADGRVPFIINTIHDLTSKVHPQ